MPRYRLRTLLIALAVGPPFVAGLYFYPTLSVLIGAIIAFVCLGPDFGGRFESVIKGGMLAFALCLLLTVFLPAHMGSRPSPTMATRMTVGFFNQAINSYRDKVGQLPSDLESLIKPPRDLPNGTDWGGPYLSYEALPVDSWGSIYQYQVVDSSKGEFRIWSKGPDKRSNTQDDIADK